MKKKTGFTLLELLISVAVVAVLITLVIMGIGKFQAKANTARCVANLRAIGSGLFAAAADNNGKVMPRVPAKNLPWPPVVDSYVGGNGLAINISTVTSQVWVCPENKARVAAFRKNGRASGLETGYPINRHLLAPVSEDGYTSGIPMARIQNPSQKVYVIESCNNDGNFGPATAMYYPPAGYQYWMKQVHPAGNNVLFCDGHVESVKPDHPLCSTTVAECRSWWLPEW